MKDTIVTARRKKTELITLLVCFVVSNLLHLYAIIAYHAPFTEMITSIFYIIISNYLYHVNILTGNWMAARNNFTCHMSCFSLY